MLIAGAPSRRRKLGREDLHVAGEDEQVDLAAEQLQHPPLGRLPASPARPGRGGRGGRARSTWSAWSGWLETTATSSAPSSPLRQRQSRSERQWSSRETMIATRLRSLDSAKRCSISQRPGDLLARSGRRAPRARPPGRGSKAIRMKKRPSPARVLVGVDDVAAGVGEEAADRGDQPGLVGAGEQQARGRGLAGDAGMIAVERDDPQRDAHSGLLPRSATPRGPDRRRRRACTWPGRRPAATRSGRRPWRRCWSADGLDRRHARRRPGRRRRDRPDRDGGRAGGRRIPGAGR